MKLRSILFPFLILLLITISVKAQTATQPAGSGSETDPYLIATLDNLYWLTQNSSVWGEGYYFEQTADIDASSTSSWNGGDGFSPIGISFSDDFLGTYNGNGFEINDLYINKWDAGNYTGFIGVLGESGVITNLGLVDVQVKGESYSGALVGRNRGTIDNSFAIGSVYIANQYIDDYRIGGLVGDNGGLIQNSYSNVSVLGNQYVGGLVGINSGTILTSYSMGSVKGLYSVGGLVGANDNIIRNSYATASVNGEDKVGGLAGENDETIDSTYATGVVKGSTEFGGLVGDDNGGIVSNSYWNTESTGQNSSAGGTGLTTSEMRQSSSFTNYEFSSIWQIDENSSYPYLQNNAESPAPGSFIVLISPNGANFISTNPTFNWIGISSATSYDLQVSTDSSFATKEVDEAGISESEFSLTSVSLNSETVFYWRVRAITSSGTEDWAELGSFTTSPSGTGTEGDPYHVTKIITLNNIRYADTAHYQLLNDIDLAEATGSSGGSLWNDGNGFEPIPDFKGSLDGNGHVISNLHINRSSSDVGLIGTLNGTVKNLGIIDAEITGGFNTGVLTGNNDGTVTNSYITGSVTAVNNYDRVGGLAGENNGTVSLSYANAFVTGDRYIGGLVGYNGSDGSIITSYSKGSLKGNVLVGGLAGYSRNIIRNSYSTAAVEGEESIGGLVGENDGSINITYAAGPVSGSTNVGGLVGYNDSGSIYDSFWSIVSTAQNSSDGGSGLTLSEMRQSSLFTDFDFSTIWQIDENSSYPYLQNNTESPPPGTFVVLISPVSKANLIPLQPDFEWVEISIATGYDLQISEDSAFATTTVNETGITESEFTLTSATLSTETNYFWRVRANTSLGTENWTEPLSFETTPYAEGTGTEGDPYQITTVSGLNSIRFDETAHYQLMNDIDLAEATGSSGGSLWNDGKGFEPIPNLEGSLDGEGHLISNLYINRDDNVIGFIKYLRGAVTNLGIVDAEIIGSNDTGVLTGYNVTGTISNSYCTGSVDGSKTGDDIGGLVGYNRGEILTSFADVSVSGDNRIGGLVGRNYEGTIRNSYATGKVSGDGSVGGLLGENDTGIVDSTYATGAVSGNASLGGVIGTGDNASNSYWNTESTGQNSSAGGTGLSASQMKQSGSFPGFDFNDIWTIKEGISFPYLQNLEPQTIPGSPSIQVSGKSLSFNSGEVTTDHDSNYDNLSEITIEGWINTNDINNRQGIISKDNEFFIDLRPELTFVVVTAGGPERAASSNITIDNNTWYHFTVTYDGTDVGIFINGKDVTDTQLLTGTGDIANTSSDVLIGDLAFTSGPFDGEMDDLRIWNDIRTPEEIRQNMYQQLNGDENGLIAYFPFDEDEAGIALNKANETNFGTLGSGISRSDDTHPYGTFITGSEGWRMMSSPFADVSYGEMLDTLWTQGFTGSDSPDYGSSNVYYYDEPSRQFTSISNATDIPGKGTGFITYVYDDQDFDSTDDGFPKVIELDSSQVSGSVSPALSFTDSGTLADDGWNLVGNPYGAAINWDASSGWGTENLDATFYIWNAEAGEYQSWNGFSGTTALSDGLIAPWQGFWVKANATAPTITFTDDIRSAGGVFRKKSPVPQVKFELVGNGLSNTSILMLNENAESGKDPLDAYKLSSLNSQYLSLFTQTEEGVALDINALPNDFDRPITVPLGFKGSNLDGRFELSWEMQALPEDWSFVLTDNETGQQIDLNKHSSMEIKPADAQSSKVSETLEDSEDEKQAAPAHGLITPRILKTTNGSATRFTLRITSQQAMSNERLADVPSQVELQQNYPNPFNPTTTITYGVPETGQVTLEVYDLLGQKVATLINREIKQAGRYSVVFDAGNLASGLYLYRLKAGNSVITKKLTLIK